MTPELSRQDYEYLTRSATKETSPFLLGNKRRATTNRAVQMTSYAFLSLALIPLAAIIFLLVTNGAPRLLEDFPYFLTVTMKNVHGGMIAGGIIHALVGTALITGGAVFISVPIGVLTAIYLVEYNSWPWLSRMVRTVVDVMSGLPSIVAGLFAAALFALGTPRYLVVLKVSLRTVASGLVTAVMLAVARIIGETAPLLMTVGVFDSLNVNLLDGRMMSLPVYIYRQFTAGLAPCAPGATDCLATINYERAWAAALVLLLMVMAFNLGARFLAARLAPQGLR